MTKQQFLSQLCDKLKYASALDRQKTLDYYAEMIDDRIEDGMSEDAAVAAMGDINTIVSQLQTPPPPKTHGRAVALGVTSPLWVPLYIAAFIVIWALVVACYAIVVGIIVAAVALGALGLRSILTSLSVQTLAFVGAMLICIGLSMLAVVGTGYAVKGAVYLTRLLWNAVFKKGEKDL